MIQRYMEAVAGAPDGVTASCQMLHELMSRTKEAELQVELATG